MNCNEIRPHLWDYYDGEGSPEIRQKIALHLPECTACSAQLKSWTELSTAAFPRPAAKAPAFLWTRVLSAIEQVEQDQAIWWRQWAWMRWVTGVVALLVLLASGIVFYQSNQGTPMELLFRGQTDSNQALRISSRPNQTDVTAWVLSSDTDLQEQPAAPAADPGEAKI